MCIVNLNAFPFWEVPLSWSSEAAMNAFTGQEILHRTLPLALQLKNMKPMKVYVCSMYQHRLLVSFIWIPAGAHFWTAKFMALKFIYENRNAKCFRFFLNGKTGMPSDLFPGLMKKGKSILSIFERDRYCTFYFLLLQQKKLQQSLMYIWTGKNVFWHWPAKMTTCRLLYILFLIILIARFQMKSTKLSFLPVHPEILWNPWPGQCRNMFFPVQL